MPITAEKSTILAELRAATVIAVLRAPGPDEARGACQALVDGGIRAIEVTYTTPDAAAVIRWAGDTFGDRVVVGAGTLTDTDQVREAVAAGARYLVSPGLDPEVAGAMADSGLLTMVGALTPSEVMAARRLSDVVKLFPGSLGGPAYLKALRGPFPDIPFMPTGGVSRDNVQTWLDAGAVAVGAGGELVPAAALAAGDWRQVTERAAGFVAAAAR
jgi:2-dehydro-3-deoxyphosphogluconate aldolase/(4S)-4-hydroxy-2-oxoglutarate aldolase